MNFFSNIFQKRENVPTFDSDKEQQDNGGNFGSQESAVATLNDALSVAAFYRGVELRANTMSMLVMQYQKRNDKAHGNHYEADMRGAGRSLNYKIQVQPNPTMTWRQLVVAAEIDRISGNAYIYVERYSDTYEIRALWLCLSATYMASSNSYNISFQTHLGLQCLSEVDAEDVIHLRNTFSHDHGLSGLSTVQFARRTLSTAATADSQVKESVAKGGRYKLIIKQESKGLGLGRIQKKELEKMRDQIRRDFSQDVIIGSNYVDVTPISQTLTEQSIDTIRKFSVRDIARYLGVPAIMLMDDSNSSYKTPEAATQEFLLRTIAPLALDWEQQLNAKLLGEEGWPTHRFHFSDESLMRLDPIARANLGKVLLETGVKCVNELRQEYDLSAVPMGDIHYVSTNLAELGSKKLSEPSATPASAAEQKKKTSGTGLDNKKGDEE